MLVSVVFVNAPVRAQEKPAAPVAPAPTAPAPPPPPGPAPAVDGDPARQVEIAISAAGRLMGSGRYDLAAAGLENVLKKEPENARATMYLGIALQKMKNYERARELLLRSQSLSGDFSERVHIPHFLGWANYYVGRTEEAKAAFTRHVTDVPTEGDSFFGLGIACKDLDDLPAAEKHLRKAIELQQQNPRRQLDVAKAHARLGEVLDLSGRAEEAINHLRIATTMMPDAYEAWFLLERAYRAAGTHELADDAQRKGEEARDRMHPKAPAPAAPPSTSGPSTQAPTNAPSTTAPAIDPAPNSTNPASAPRSQAAHSPPLLRTLLATAVALPRAHSAPDQPAESRLHFTDVTAASGLSIVTTCGGTPSTQVPEVKGGGLALIDFDGDGDLDVFIPNGATLADPENGPGARLYENQGKLTFRDVTSSSGIGLKRWSYGVAVGDYDGDAREDLYVCCLGSDVLYRNLGGGKFEDVTAAAGLGDGRWSAAASFGDLDNDGDLDLYVANYLAFDFANPPSGTVFKGVPVISGPFGMAAEPDALYENLGDGSFRDVSEASGILGVKPAYGLNVVILDADDDGKQDILVGNDSHPNHLFHNQGGMKFVEVGRRWGFATNREGTEQATMGMAVADVDGNGRADIFSTVFSSDTNSLHLNKSGTYFDERSQNPWNLGVVSRPYLGWACSFQDFDVDGDEDLLIFNGHVYSQATKATMDSDYAQAPLLHVRDGSTFRTATPESAGAWLGEAHVDRSAGFTDLDGDGDVDVIVTELNGPVRVLRNDCNPRPGEWLAIQLRDDRPGVGNRFGAGARLEVAAAGRVHRRWLYGGGPFQSNAPLRAHIGLGPGVTAVDVTVVWPDGVRQEVQAAAPGSLLTVTRP